MLITFFHINSFFSLRCDLLVTVKFLHHVKNSTEKGYFLRFNAYICHAIDDFACLELQH